jgi:hypothetical protein
MNNLIKCGFTQAIIDYDIKGVLKNVKWLTELELVISSIQFKFFTQKPFPIDYDDILNDPLGSSLSVIYNIALPHHYNMILGGLYNLHSSNDKCGIGIAVEKNGCKNTLWPHIQCYCILALRKMGYNDFARKQLEKIGGLYEYYVLDGDTIKNDGEIKSGCAAALLLEVLC